nr:hypothetical protein Iba_chr08aCG10120 [Ipomoea batatas]
MAASTTFPRKLDAERLLGMSKQISQRPGLYSRESNLLFLWRIRAEEHRDMASGFCPQGSDRIRWRTIWRD